MKRNQYKKVFWFYIIISLVLGERSCHFQLRVNYFGIEVRPKSISMIYISLLNRASVKQQWKHIKFQFKELIKENLYRFAITDRGYTFPKHRIHSFLWIDWVVTEAWHLIPSEMIPASPQPLIPGKIVRSIRRWWFFCTNACSNLTLPSLVVAFAFTSHSSVSVSSPWLTPSIVLFAIYLTIAHLKCGYDKMSWYGHTIFIPVMFSLTPLHEVV